MRVMRPLKSKTESGQIEGVQMLKLVNLCTILFINYKFHSFTYLFRIYNTDLYLSNRKRFPCLHSLIETLKGLGEFSTVMQTRDKVKDLHNCREFSQPLECLNQAMQTQEKSFLLLL